MFSAFLDANVLVPVTLTDTILRCAERELFAPLWSRRVLEEASRAVLRIRPGLSPSRVEYRFACMHQSFREASVENYEGLVEKVVLPDADDRHVVAAASMGSADLIVTRNLKHFPKAELTRFGLEVVSPDRFLCDMLDLAPAIVYDAVKSQANDAQIPHRTVDDVLIGLGRAGATEFVAAFRASVQKKAE